MATTTIGSFTGTVSFGNNDSGESPFNFSLKGIVSSVQSNQPPVIGAFDVAVTYVENAVPLVLDSNTTITDLDSSNFDTGKLTIQLVSNAEVTDRLEIHQQGNGAGQIAVSGSNVSYGGTVFGTFTGGSGGNALETTFNVNATPIAVQALLQNITYRSLSENPLTTARTVQVTLTDGDGGISNQPTKFINVNAVNDPPVFLSLAPLITHSANGQTISIPLTLADAETPVGNLAVSVDWDNKTVLPDRNAFISLVNGQQFLNVTATRGVTGTVRINLAVRDGAVLPDGSLVVTRASFDLKIVNFLPVVENFDGEVNYQENGGGLLLDTNATVADADSANFENGKLTVQLIGGAQSTDGLGIQNQGLSMGQIGANGSQVSYEGFVIGTYTGGTGSTPLVVSFNSNATPANVQALVRNLTFRNSSDNPSTMTRTVRVILSDGDGGTSLPVAKTINVVAVNDSPVIASFDATVTYTENGAAILLDADATVTDVDSPNLSGGKLTISLTTNAQSSDLVSIRNQGIGTGLIGLSGSNVTFGGIVIGSYTGGTGSTPLVVSFNSNATPANVQALVRNLTFRNSSDNPSTMTRTVRVILSDGDGGTSLPVTKTINVVAVNDPPVIASFDATVTYTENGAAILLDADATVTDVDSPNLSGGKLTISLTTNAQSSDLVSIRNQGIGTGLIGLNGSNVTFGGIVIGSYIGGTGSTPLVVSFNSNATPANVQALVRNLTFRNSSDNPSTMTRTVRVILSDGDGGTSLPVTKAINVVAVNDPPVIASFDATVTYTENGAAILLDADATVTDVDSPNLSGGKLTISLTTNAQSSDLVSIRNQGIGTGLIGLNGSNVTFGGIVIGSYIGGTGSTPLVVSFNSNATPANVQALVRNLTFRNSSDNPSTMIRTIRVSLSDGDGGTSLPVTKTINVVAINDAPQIAAFDLPVTYRANSAAILLDGDATITDLDSTNLDTGKLTISLTANPQTSDLVSIRNQGVAAGQIGVNGSKITYGGLTIGSFTGGAGTAPLVVTFNVNATPAIAQAVLRNITYKNKSTVPSTLSRTVKITLTDGDGGTSNSATKLIKVTH